PTPSPSPTATGTPLVAPGLAPGERARINSSAALAPSSASTANASESKFAPWLPIELNGVSVSIRGAACGLYAVSSSAISFVVPPGLVTSGTSSFPIVINIQDSPGVNRVIRGSITIVAAQPDIETTSNGPNGRAVICNITNPMTFPCQTEPFNVTSPDASGSPVPTILEMHLTGEV